MQFFKDTILELSAVQELQKYLNRGVSPISFSGSGLAKASGLEYNDKSGILSQSYGCCHKQKESQRL